MRASLVIEALSHASKVRGSLKGAIFHFDHGSVHLTGVSRPHCAQLGVRQSMGAVGTSADNALAESFNATLKREVLRDRKVFDSPISCRQEVFRWCMRYNTRRRHSWCNLLAPDDFEALTSATTDPSSIANLRCVYFPGVRPLTGVNSWKVSGLPLEGVWEMPARYIGKNWEVLTDVVS